VHLETNKESNNLGNMQKDVEELSTNILLTIGNPITYNMQAPVIIVKSNLPENY